MNITTTTTTTTVTNLVVMTSENAHGGNLAWEGCDLPPCSGLVFVAAEFWEDDDVAAIGCDHTMPEMFGLPRTRMALGADTEQTECMLIGGEIVR